MGFDPNIRVELRKGARRRFYFGAPQVGGGMRNLALKIAEFKGVAIHKIQRADPRRHQVIPDWLLIPAIVMS